MSKNQILVDHFFQADKLLTAFFVMTYPSIVEEFHNLSDVQIHRGKSPFPCEHPGET